MHECLIKNGIFCDLPALFASLYVARWIGASKSDICIDPHELMLDRDLQTLGTCGMHSLLYFGQYMLDYAFINGLLDNLKDAVFDNSISSYEAGSRTNNFRDEVIRPKYTSNGITGAVDDRSADEGESGKEHGVAVAYIR